MVLEVVDAAELNAADHARAVHEPAPVLEGGLRRRDRALQAEERAEHLVGSIVDEVRLRMRRGTRAALDEEGVNAKAGEQDRKGQTDGAAADDDHGNVRVAGGGGRRGGGARCRAGGREERRHAARAFGRPGVTRGGASARIARTTRVMVTEPDAADAPATCARDTPPRLRVKCTRESRSS